MSQANRHNTDLHTEIETGREIIANTAITLIVILVLAGVGFWIGW